MKSQIEIEALMNKARETNARRDGIERAIGFAAQPDISEFQQLRTVDFALEASLKTEDWNCVAEARAMLQHLIERIKDAANRAN
jgi:hypothetical protein